MPHVMSWDIPEFLAYRNAALALHDVAREIEARQNSKHAIERKIMPALIAKRDRLIAEVAPLKAAADAAERAAVERMCTPSVVPPTRSELWSAADGLDIPAFLRRQAR